MNQKHRRQTKRLKKTDKEITGNKRKPTELSQEDFNLQAAWWHIFHAASYN